jgi:ATP-binding cassette subfamily C (CFTR/MRP) protein 1
MDPLLAIGNKQKKLNPHDLDTIPLPKDCSTQDVVENFDRYWNKELKATDVTYTKRWSSLLEAPSLFRALCLAFGGPFVRAGLLKLVHDLCIFVGPQVLNGLVLFLGDADASMSRGLWLTLAVTLSQLTMSFCLRHYFFECYLTGLRVRTSVVVAVYQKTLRLSSGERQSRSLGELTNLMSIDAQRMQGMPHECGVSL